VFVCVTGPSFPGLSILTTTLMFVGDCCVEVALASDFCFVGALCSAVCVWPDAAPESFCDCVPLCATSFALPAELEAGLVFVWVAFSEPPVLEFTGAWVAVAVDPAFWSVEAVCSVDCDCPELGPEPFCVCVTLWLVELSFVADDVAVLELVCSTDPQSPSPSPSALAVST
jgi:hypothetical protein